MNRKGDSMSTLAISIGRPEPGEYAPYYERYISQIPGDDVLATLDEQGQQMLLLLSSRSEAEGNLRYAPEKWSVKEVLGHVCDAERVFAYRALRISRNDATPLPGFDENEYIKNGPFAHLSLAELIEDYIAVRRSTLTLLHNLDEAAWTRRGLANQQQVTVRALAYIIAGHDLHHRCVLQERYLK